MASVLLDAGIQNTMQYLSSSGSLWWGRLLCKQWNVIWLDNYHCKIQWRCKLGELKEFLILWSRRMSRCSPKVTELQWAFQNENMKHLCWVTRNVFKKVHLNVKTVINRLRDSEDCTLKFIINIQGLKYHWFIDLPWASCHLKYYNITLFLFQLVRMSLKDICAVKQCLR